MGYSETEFIKKYKGFSIEKSDGRYYVYDEADLDRKKLIYPTMIQDSLKNVEQIIDRIQLTGNVSSEHDH